jgi:hypothetical protein
MLSYGDLEGLPYLPGRDDCYSIGRKFFLKNFGIRLKNYARPDRFWEDTQLDLYKFYNLEGFEVVFDQKIEIGDVLLMPLLTPFATHACIMVDDNVILHHLPGQLSATDRMRPKWSNRATIIVRHPRVTEIQKSKVNKVHLNEVTDADIFRDPEYQKTFDRVLESQRGEMRDDQS